MIPRVPAAVGAPQHILLIPVGRSRDHDGRGRVLVPGDEADFVRFPSNRQNQCCCREGNRNDCHWEGGTILLLALHCSSLELSSFLLVEGISLKEHRWFVKPVLASIHY